MQKNEEAAFAAYQRGAELGDSDCMLHYARTLHGMPRYKMLAELCRKNANPMCFLIDTEFLSLLESCLWNRTSPMMKLLSQVGALLEPELDEQNTSAFGVVLVDKYNGDYNHYGWKSGLTAVIVHRFTHNAWKRICFVSSLSRFYRLPRYVTRDARGFGLER